jgi:V8-like Glu-specific endopeptidase
MKQKILTTLAMFFLLTSISTLLSGAKHALLIGVEDYGIAGLKSLKGPGNDLELMKKVLRDRFQFQGKNITVLMDEQATHTKVQKALECLAKRIKKGDLIYIHYSGHGSYVKDENGDEHPRDFDQTWVTYGSRSNALKGNDRYDVTDDLLFEWLTPIFEKSKHVMFVSDSCHSGSISRGETPTVRAVARDKQKYPFGEKIFSKPDFKNGVRIGASEDVESAYEYRQPNGKTYGAFTWYWAQALQQAQPDNTWLDIFKQTQVKITGRFSSQIPQFQGDIVQPVFGGKFKKVSPRIPVSQVMECGKKIRIEKGSLSGVTIGSLYRKYDPKEKDKSRLPIMEITRVEPFYSEAVASSTLCVGDLIIEKEHAYRFQPIRVFINADDLKDEDKQVLGSLRNLFTGEKPKLQGFQLARNQPDSEIVLYILRPQNKGGEFVKKSPTHTLPQSFPGQPPEVWVLNNCEKNPLFYDIHIPFCDLSKGTKLIIENLRKIARLKEIESLSSGTTIDMELKTSIWEPVKKCPQNQEDCLYLKDINRYFKRQKTYGLKEIENHNRLPKDTLLTFNLKNNTSTNYYTYLLDIMMDGNVKPVYPSLNDRIQDALLPFGKSRDFKDKVVLLLDKPGRETIKLIITEQPIDISLLQQDNFNERGGEKAKMNALERLLTNSLFGKKGQPFRVYKTQWGIKHFNLFITTRQSIMNNNSQEKNLKLKTKFTVGELDKELIARGAQIPAENLFEFEDRQGSPERDTVMKQIKNLYGTAPSPNKALSHISTLELAEILMLKTRGINRKRGIWGKDDRQDYYEIKDEQIKRNAGGVVAIYMKEDLIDSGKGISTLRVKNYGKSFNLAEAEPFRNQPIAAGRLCTGFLVKDDVIATAAHCASEKNVTDLRFVFGYKMLAPFTPVTQVAKESIYKGVKIIERVYNRKAGEDWALIQLDRSVVGQPVVTLSEKEISCNQPVYIIGHPVGLPLKYTPGAYVRNFNETCFSADLDVYCGNSGSPVFDSETHEVIGIVIRGDNRDFRWTGNGWISVIYPNPDFKSKEPQCTRVSKFVKCCR